MDIPCKNVCEMSHLRDSIEPIHWCGDLQINRGMHWRKQSYSSTNCDDWRREDDNEIFRWFERHNSLKVEFYREISNQLLRSNFLLIARFRTLFKRFISPVVDFVSLIKFFVICCFMLHLLRSVYTQVLHFGAISE